MLMTGDLYFLEALQQKHPKNKYPKQANQRSGRAGTASRVMLGPFSCTPSEEARCNISECAIQGAPTRFNNGSNRSTEKHCYYTAGADVSIGAKTTRLRVGLHETPGRRRNPPRRLLFPMVENDPFFERAPALERVIWAPRVVLRLGSRRRDSPWNARQDSCALPLGKLNGQQMVHGIVQAQHDVVLAVLSAAMMVNTPRKRCQERNSTMWQVLPYRKQQACLKFPGLS